MTRIVTKKLRAKRCRNTACRTEFVPARPLQTACSVACAIALTQTAKARQSREQDKQERAARRAARERIKTKGDYMRETQAAFNEWIRERDRDLPCISCGRFHQGQWHAGHYRTVGGNPELRFHPLNCHRQCAPCNNHKSGDIVNYRINLVERIGADQVEWLEGPHEPQRYTIEELKAMKASFRAMTRSLKGRAA
ncbi:recombination protein NinG [Stutzerimonas nitrititolerans]|uniref:Recombination protein NinG n=1 Tax=Stutzerimonas nitrititolerans TaxID=2482751 RepID=A0ABX9UUW6_9GAMM|nr:recombination protein NinG [Stutzerimonas nitrititolerans]RMH96414.1 recombination protein NinG [Stutzerimonas nitrititolerans]